MSKKVLLMILDGWGINSDPAVSAIAQAYTPFMDSCVDQSPHATLSTFGDHVGLPDGQMGNSEVGHIHLGAGRIVYQNLEKINRACKNGSLAENTVLIDTFEYCKKNKQPLHLLGLVSNGGVHAHIDHLLALIKAANQASVTDIYIHAITDGRDCDPKSGLGFIETLEKEITPYPNTKLVSIVGRYYAMDRDKRWERVKKAYDLLTKGTADRVNSFQDAIKESYTKGITDEFMEPMWLESVPISQGTIQNKNAVVFFNFRTDRGRELTETLTQKEFPAYNMHPLDLYYVTMTTYDDTFKNIKVLFREDPLKNTLGEIISKSGKKQLRIAETEKYPHVTFFFSGGQEDMFTGEQRILCPSPRDVATYDLKPEMAAYDIRDRVVPLIKNGDIDFICLNFANADMVGHTGDMQAAIKACEVVDQCAKEICEAALKENYEIIILADHGNADVMINPDGTPNTQHSTNPVPLILLSNNKDITLRSGGLGDIAPTILSLMDLPIPHEMDGKILIERNFNHKAT